MSGTSHQPPLTRRSITRNASAGLPEARTFSTSGHGASGPPSFRSRQHAAPRDDLAGGPKSPTMFRARSSASPRAEDRRRLRGRGAKRSDVIREVEPRRSVELRGIQDKIIEAQDKGYCILREHFAWPLIDACRDAFWPILLACLKIHGDVPNRGPRRHFLTMPFEPPCCRSHHASPENFSSITQVLNIVRGVMDDRVVADQWGCDVQGSLC